MNELDSLKEGLRDIKEGLKPIFIGIIVFILGVFISGILSRSGSEIEPILWAILYLSSIVAVCTSIIVRCIKNNNLNK